MAGGDTLASLGGKVTDVFVSAFASGNANVSLVFLPFALPTPDNIVQGGVVNPTRLASFLSPNFDAPYLMSASQYSVHGKDLYYGSASQIYTLAVSLAQPTPAVGSDAWKRVNTEIAMAQSLLSPQGTAPAMACVPDDWVLPDSTSYWSTFDSTQSQGGPATTGRATTGGDTGRPMHLAFSPALWTIKPAAAQAVPVQNLTYLHAIAPAEASPLLAHATVAPQPATLSAMTLKPATLSAVAMKPAPSFTMSAVAAKPALANVGVQPIRAMSPSTATLLRANTINRATFTKLGPPPPPSPPPPPPSSSMTVHFDYMSATIGFMAAGASIWNGAFLADTSWCVPGMTKGGLLPAPNVAAAPGEGTLSYGLPIAIIIVKNLKISVKWAGQEQTNLGNSGGFLGPFSLAGASATNAPDGTWTYSRPGMQVVALLCSHLPVLPPNDAPDVAGAAADAGAGADVPEASPATTADPAAPAPSGTPAGGTPAAIRQQVPPPMPVMLRPRAAGIPPSPHSRTAPTTPKLAPQVQHQQAQRPKRRLRAVLPQRHR